MAPSTRKRSAKAQEQIASYAEVFRALGDPMRTEIIRRAALMDELPCTHLESALPVSKSTISYHVKILFQAGLLEVRKEGRFYFYRLREDTMGEILPEFLGQLRETSLNDSGVDKEPKARVRRKAAA